MANKHRPLVDRHAPKNGVGWLDEHVHVQMPSGQRLLDVDGLKEKLKSVCQWRIDSIFL